MRYDRILTRLCNTPLAISQDKLSVITSNVTLKLLADQRPASLEKVEHEVPTKAKVSVIKIFDSLVAKNGSGDSGSTSYESITRAINAELQNGSKHLLFYIDSPGGEVAGLFGLAEYIKSLSTTYGIKTTAITDGMATSAAYVLAAACTEVYATSSSILGSIGVIMTIINMVEADKEDKVSYTIIRSKEDKALINPHEELTSKAIDKAKTLLKSLDTIMNDTVNRFRPNLSVKTIIDLKGDTFLAEEALSFGLIDRIVTSLDEAISLTTMSGARLQRKSNLTGANMLTDEEIQTLQTDNVRLRAEVQTLKAQEAVASLAAKNAEQTRILGIIDAGKTFNLDSNVVIKRIKANSSVEDSVSMFEDIAEAMGVNSHVPTEGTDLPSLNPSVISTDLLSEEAIINAALEKIGSTSSNMIPGIF